MQNPPAPIAHVDLQRSAPPITHCAQVAEQLLTQGPRLPDSRQLCAEVLLDVGTARKAAGDSHRALALYGRILDVLPESSQALYHIGVLAYERGSKGDAKALYRRAVAADPGNVQVR